MFLGFLLVVGVLLTLGLMAFGFWVLYSFIVLRFNVVTF